MEQHIKEGQIIRRKKVSDIVNNFNNADSLVFNDYRGLSVLQISEIRRALRDKGAFMHVHKNRLVKHAVREKQYPENIEEHLSGPTAITYIKGDPTPVLKALFEFAKKEYPIAVRGAFIDNTVFDASEAEKISKLPTKEELIARFMATMQAPTQNLAMALNDIITRFARVLQAVADSKE